MRSLSFLILTLIVACSYAQVCPPGQALCEGTEDECIPEEFVCDGTYIDCSNDADETDCPCPPGYYTCKADGSCIPEGWVCDKAEDCPGGDDEDQDCPPKCSEYDFVCSDGSCVFWGWVCDGWWDCPNDESNCTCREDQFQCNDGLCLPGSYECDNEDDCLDRSDESNCTRSELSPKLKRTKILSETAKLAKRKATKSLKWKKERLTASNRSTRGRGLPRRT